MRVFFIASENHTDIMNIVTNATRSQLTNYVVTYTRVLLLNGMHT